MHGMVIGRNSTVLVRFDMMHLQHLPERRGVIIHHRTEAYVSAIKQDLHGHVTHALLKQQRDEILIAVDTRAHGVIVTDDALAKRSQQSVSVIFGVYAKGQRNGVGSPGAVCVLFLVIEMTDKGFRDLIGKVGIILCITVAKLIAQLCHLDADLIEHQSRGLRHGNATLALLTARRTPVAKSLGNDIILGSCQLVLYPGLHEIPVGRDGRGIVAVMIQPIRNDDLCTAPQRRCLTASALAGRDHAPGAVDLLLCANVAHVLFVCCGHVVIHDARVANDLCVTQPAAFFACGTVLGETVIVGTEGAANDLVEQIQVLVGRFKRTVLLKIGRQCATDRNIGTRNLTVFVAEINAGNLNIAEAVVGKSGTPDLTLLVTSRNINILLYALGSKAARGAVVKLTCGADCLGISANDQLALGASGQMVFHHAREVFTKVNDPCAVAAAASGSDALGGNALDDLDRRDITGLELSLGHVVHNTVAPACIATVSIGKIGRFKSCVIGFAVVKVIVCDGAVFAFPGGIGDDGLAGAVLVFDLKSCNQTDLTVGKAVIRPYLALIVKALAKPCGQGVLGCDHTGNVIGAVQHLFFVVGERRVDIIVGYLLAVDIVFCTSKAARIQHGASDGLFRLKLLSHIGRPADDVVRGRDPLCLPHIGIQLG